MAIKQIAASGGDYTSLSAWVAYLVTRSPFTEPEIAELHGFDLVDAPDTYGLVTSAANYLEIRAAAGHEHNGVFGTGARVRCGTGSSVAPIQFTGRHVRFTGIGIYQDSPSGGVAALQCTGHVAGSDVRVDKCLIRSTQTGVTSALELAPNLGNCNFTITNTVVVAAGRGMDTRNAVSVKIHNCVVWGLNGELLIIADGNTEIKNTYSGGNTSGAFWTGMTPAGGNNASSDGTATFGTGNIVNLAGTSAFTAPGTLDFSIPSGSPLVNAGTTVASVTTDIAAVARPQGAAYDIGVFEYASGGGGTDATAPGAILAGTGTISGGTATGNGGATDATAPGATMSGAGAITGGSASTTGSFSFDACENNTHSGVLSGIAVVWTWLGGGVGLATSITNGGGTITSTGLTINGLPVGAGCGILRTTDGTVVAYQEGTVS